MFCLRKPVFFLAVATVALAMSPCAGPGLAQETRDAKANASSSGSQGLWVSNDYGGFVSEFQGAALSSSGIPSRTFNTGISSVGAPGKVAFDADGDAWLPLCGSGEGGTLGLAIELSPAALNAIASGHLAGAKIEAEITGLSCPQGTAFDANGNLWIANVGWFSPPNPFIVEYKAQELLQKIPAASVVITSTSFFSLGGMAFDSSGNLWIANRGSDVLEFTTAQLSNGGDLSPNLTLHSNYNPYDVVFDHSGNLWVSYPPNENMAASEGALEMFARGDLTGSGEITPTPLVTITPLEPCSPFAICEMQGEAIDSQGDLWVAAADEIAEFTPQQLGSSGSPLPHLIWAANFAPLGRAMNLGNPSFLTFGPTVR